MYLPWTCFYLTCLKLSFPGFRMNASSWPMFLLRTLNGAEMAPGTAFKKVSPTEKSSKPIWFSSKSRHWGLCACYRNLRGPVRTTSSQAWSWKPWTRRTRTSSARPPSERWRATRSSSCSTAGAAPSITGASSTRATSSPSTGVPSPSTASSHQATVVRSRL